jgi:alpha-L-fucosidase
MAVALGGAALRAGEIPEQYEMAIDAQLAAVDKGVAKGPYKADWDDLEKHTEAPEWFRDAKFGIYWHWGVYSVPAFGNEWYPRHMHMKKRREYKHHAETYGEPDEFGYHDFVPRFTAEHFDADDWAELLEKAGAQYAGPVCEHHDGFSMWDSAITPWNAGDKGPKRDITGELAEAIRKRGMRVVTTFHHGRTNEWYPRVEGWPTTTTDPVLRMLYAHVSDTLYYQIFLAKLGEVIDKYRPDLIWFDGRIENIEESYHRRFLAYYFNNAREWGRDVVVTTKGHDYPPEIAVEDFEKGRMNRLTDFCWLTDDTISMGSWCYTRGLRIKPTTKVIHDFIDIVSKNGCLLLNISPKSDGTIPDEQRKVLLGMGEWLKVNGEAIYSTRPWLAFGEGPTRLRKGGGFVGHVKYTARDIRYTRSKDGQAVYAIALGWPEGDALTLTAVKVNGTKDARVQLLGRDEPLPHKLNDAKQLVIDVSAIAEDQRPCGHAYAFKLTGFTASLHPEAAVAPAPQRTQRRPKKPKLSKDLTLEAGEVGLSGPGIRLETKGGGKPNIGFWDHPKAKATWQVQVKTPGRYAVKAVIAATAPSTLALDAGEQTLTADVPETGSWSEQKTIALGTIQFAKPGKHELVLRPAEPAKWKAVNVWTLELAPAK